MTLTLRSTSTLELNLVAVTTFRSLGSTAPTATPGVSTSSGGAIKIAAWLNSTKNPFASLSVEGRGLYPAKKKTIPNSTSTTSLQLRGKHTHNLLFSLSTAIHRRRGQRRWRRSPSPTWVPCPRTDPPNSASTPPIPTSALSAHKVALW